MLSRVQFERWIKDNGPYLGHEVAGERMIPYVLRDGLLPRALTGQNRNSSNPRIYSRKNHVYLGTGRYLSSFHMAPTFIVDLRKLDPALIDADEDNVFDYLNSGDRELVGSDLLAQARPSREEIISGGDWADAWTAICDQPEWVLWSLEKGSCAYRGVVPARALKLNPREYVVCDWEPAPAEAQLRLPGELAVVAA